MATELATRGPLDANIEKVLIGGNLKDLTPEQRLSYYNNLCTSLGLNPLTQPFEYIVLNGKLQLYAKKDCTEQLRKIHGVSITSVDPKQIGDLLVVVAAAKDATGRVDSSTGAVNMSGLKGEALANAMMKCETKAKRRVTLSLCGLGMLDETEIQTLKEQGVASEPQGNKWVEPPTLEMKAEGYPANLSQEQSPILDNPDSEPDITPKSRKANPAPPQAPAPQQQAIQGEVTTEPRISPAQGKRFFAIARSAGVSDDEVTARLAKLGYTGHRDEMPKRIYNAAVDAVDPQMKFHTNEPRG